MKTSKTISFNVIRTILIFVMMLFVSCNSNELGVTSLTTEDIGQHKETSDGSLNGVWSDIDTALGDNMDNVEMDSVAEGKSDTETEPNIDVDPISTILTSLTAYQEYIASNKMPEDFISYEKLSSVGEFDSLTFRESGNHFYYHYNLISENGFAIMINISRLDKGETLVSGDRSGRKIVYPDTIIEEKICFDEQNSNKIIVYNDIAYRYDTKGELQYVSIISGNYMISFSPQSTYIESQKEFVGMKFSDYKAENENILTCLLSGNEKREDISSFLNGTTQTENGEHLEEKTDTEETATVSDEAVEEELDNKDESNDLSANAQPDYSLYTFNSVSELEDSLKNAKGVDLRENFEAKSEAYRYLVNKFESKDERLTYPVLKSSEKISFASQIALFSSELYGLPWIWYQGTVNGSRLTVKISYVSEELIDHANNHSMSETVRYISPSAPNVDNYESKSSYSLIAERMINVNGTDTDALISNTVSGETYIQFFVDDMLVVVSGASELLSAELISDICFVSVE